MSDPDLFGNGPSQQDLFADQPAPPRKIMDFQAEARKRLTAVLEKARAAPAQPWTSREMSMWQILFPQMAGWLPEDESKQLCFEFAQEIERLKKAA